MDDRDIIYLFFQREEEAINQAQRKYGSRLFAVADNILQNFQDAEESVSDTFLKAWEIIPPKEPEILGAFLSKITRNIAINKWKAKNAARRGKGEVDLLLSELEESIPTASTTESAYESRMVTESINRFLETLKKTDRHVFILRYFHGYSIDNLCERLEMSQSKTKSLLFRTRKKLKLHLEKEGVVL